MVENLISSGIEDHTFGPMNLRERFPEEELTLGKNRFLEVASLEECDFFHFPFPGFPNKIQGNTRVAWEVPRHRPSFWSSLPFVSRLAQSYPVVCG